MTCPTIVIVVGIRSITPQFPPPYPAKLPMSRTLFSVPNLRSAFSDRDAPYRARIIEADTLMLFNNNRTVEYCSAKRGVFLRVNDHYGEKATSDQAVKLAKDIGERVYYRCIEYGYIPEKLTCLRLWGGWTKE